MTEPLVTVLTPVYNGEKYLAECIDSVLAQSYSRWEYWIVENRSTDRTREIARAYAERDSRIRLYENPAHVSMPENHNVALRLVSPESRYCKFVHADDWLFPRCLEEMVGLAEKHPSVGVVGAYGLSGERVRWDGLPYPNSVVPGREVCRRTLLGGFYVFGSPTSQLLRADLVRGRALYNPNRFHTQLVDQEVCYELLRSSDFGFVHQVLTYSREHAGSVTSSLSEVNAAPAAQLKMLIQYGPAYLTEEEYDRRFRQLMRRYYRFLAAAALQLKRDRAFWEYHRRALAYLGHPLSVGRMLKEMPAEMLLKLVRGLALLRPAAGRFSIFAFRAARPEP